MLRGDDLEITMRDSGISYSNLELLAERLVVEEHPVIVMGHTIVEPVLDLMDARDHGIKFRVANQRNNSRLRFSDLEIEDLLGRQVVQVQVSVVAKPLNRIGWLRLGGKNLGRGG